MLFPAAAGAVGMMVDLHGCVTRERKACRRPRQILAPGREPAGKEWRRRGRVVCSGDPMTSRSVPAARLVSVLRAGALAGLATLSFAAPVPDDFPRFIVPGHEREMDALRAMYWLHYQPAGPIIPLWDEWMPKATLWPARDGDRRDAMRRRWAEALSTRPMSAEGYVLTMQHDGPAHAEGWPFPTWKSAGGIGWHFRGTGVKGYDAPTVGSEGWAITGGRLGEIDERGLAVELTAPDAVLKIGRAHV